MFEQLRDADKIKMTHTGLIQGKNGKVIHVIFERETDTSKNYAELVLPSRKVLKNDGFEDGELAQLKLFLKSQEREIIQSAKQINHDIIYKL